MTALIIFILSLVLMAVLFIIKYIEAKRSAVLFSASQRAMFDAQILAFEHRCKAECTLQRLASILHHAYNTLAHKFAKLTASIAKRVEWRARSVAHKSARAKMDGEQVRENGYLREVQEHKDSLDTARVAEETKL